MIEARLSFGFLQFIGEFFIFYFEIFDLFFKGLNLNFLFFDCL